MRPDLFTLHDEDGVAAVAALERGQKIVAQCLRGDVDLETSRRGLVNETALGSHLELHFHRERIVLDPFGLKQLFVREPKNAVRRSAVEFICVGAEDPVRGVAVRKAYVARLTPAMPLAARLDEEGVLARASREGGGGGGDVHQIPRKRRGHHKRNANEDDTTSATRKIHSLGMPGPKSIRT